MYKLAIGPLTISGILKNAWSLYKHCIKHILLWSFILSIVHIIPYLFGFIGFLRKYNSHFVFSWWGFFIFAALLIVEAFFVAVIFYNMYSLATEQKVTYSKSFKLAKDRLIPLYFGMIAYYIAVTIGIFLFLLPSVFVAVLFSMFLPFIIIENRTVYHAFQRSAYLIWGHWWQTFFVLVIPYAVAYLVRHFAKFTPWVGEWERLIDVVVLTFIMPYFYSVLLVQYNNLKIIKSLPEPTEPAPRIQTE